MIISQQKHVKAFLPSSVKSVGQIAHVKYGSKFLVFLVTSFRLMFDCLYSKIIQDSYIFSCQCNEDLQRKRAVLRSSFVIC